MLSYVQGCIELRVGIPVQESQFQGGITSLAEGSIICTRTLLDTKTNQTFTVRACFFFPFEHVYNVH